MKNNKITILLGIVLSLCLAFVGTFLTGCFDNPKAIQSIYIKEGTYQAEIEHNGTFSTDNIEVYAKFNGGDEKKLDNQECQFSQIDTSIVGTQKLTVSYEAYETSVNITVYKTLSSISVQGAPTLVMHNSNGGELDLTNAVIVLTYSDNTKENVNIYTDGILTNGVVVENNSTTTVGNFSLKITYRGKQCTSNYTVEKVLVKIEAKLDAKYTSVAYMSEFRKDLITAVATYSDGTTENFSNDKLEIENLDTTNKENIKDDNIVKVTLKENTQFSSNVKVKIYAQLQSISYTSGLPTQIKYNTELDTSNLEVLATYNDNTTKEIVAGIVVDGYNKLTLGQQTLQLKYKDQTVADYVTTTTNIEVYEELESIKVEYKNTNDLTTGYILFDETKTWDDVKESVVAKFKLIAVYTKNEQQLQNSDVSFGSIDISTLGDKQLSVSYQGKSVNITINVIESWDEVENIEISSIEVVDNSVASEVDYNGTLDTSELKITVTYTNNMTQTLLASEHTNGEDQITISSFDTSIHGTQNLLVSYKEKQCSKQIVVKKILTSIEIKSGTQVECVIYGEQPDLTGVVIVATYSDNSTENVDANVDLSKFDENELGEQTITFTYSMTKVDKDVITKSASMTCKVCDKVISLEGVQVPSKRCEYGTEYDYSSVKATATFVSGATLQLTGSELTFSGLNVNVVKTQTLTISYAYNGEKVNATVDIEVYDVLQSISVESGLSDTVDLNGTLNTSNVVIKLTYKSGATENIATGFTISEFSTNREGEFELKISYQGKECSKTISVVRTYTIIGYVDPTFVTVYNRNKQNENTFNTTGSTGNKGFTVKNNMYVVGNENNFVYNPTIKTSDLQEITEFRANIKVYIKNASDVLEELTDELSSYVSFDDTLHTFKFTELAENNIFKIEMLPYTIKANEQENVEKSSLEFKVIKAYNVYNAHDLSMFDNQNLKNKWSEKKTEEEIELSKNIHGLVLHSNISIQDSDLPSVQFFKEDEIPSTDADYSKVVGSLKDSEQEYLGKIYLRKETPGSSFTVEGNYFQISAQDLSHIVREMKSGTWPVSIEGEGITVHTKLFGFYTSDEKSTTLVDYFVNNISFFGNCKKSEDSVLSGGVIGVVARNVNFTAYNNLSQGWFINYMFEGNSTQSDNCVNTLDKVNAYDAYSSLLYVWATRDLRISDCIIIGAGGPVMICDHVDNNETTGEGGYISNVTVSNSILQSYVAGTEGWFATYTGSGAFVSSFKAMNALITKYGNSICDTAEEKINLIAIYKSGDVSGITTSKIRGTFQDSNEKHTNGLDLSSENVDTIKNQIIAQLARSGMTNDQIASTVGGMAVLQTFNGCIAVPGSAGWFSDATTPDATKFASAEDYMNVYLFNGMAVVLGLNKLS